MFFDPASIRSEQLSMAWRAAHQMDDAGHPADDRNNLPGICSTVSRWISSEHRDPRLRMSLRSGAALVAGSAQLCLKRLNELVEDASKLDSELTFRRKRPRFDSAADEQTGSENSEKKSVTPEEMMGLGRLNDTVYITFRKKRNTSFEMSPLIPKSPNVSPLEQSNIDNLTSCPSEELIPFPSHQTSENSCGFDTATSPSQVSSPTQISSPLLNLDQLASAQRQNTSKEQSVTENCLNTLSEDQRRSKTFTVEKTPQRNAQCLCPQSKNSDDQQDPHQASYDESLSHEIKEKATQTDSPITTDASRDSDNSQPLDSHSKNSENLQNPDQTSEDNCSSPNIEEKGNQTECTSAVHFSNDSENMSNSSSPLSKHNGNNYKMQESDLPLRDKPKVPSTIQEGTQTDHINVVKKPPAHEQFYADHPYGVILVHENFHSRFPSKVICTSLNADVMLIK